ncbi:MAG: NAD(P)H-dependent oxidoreductase subunit E [Pseudomonadota bacterium]|nr:NAD(P)H-dependent oxidoreductase subunit E [Pseudomonadota bacterium]MEE3295688.1 NAD(P)H-dependent oxidoreductase subunit E [Pseudomonadota bacterium]
MTQQRFSENNDKEFRFNEKEINEINLLINKYPIGREQSAVLECLFLAQKKSGGWLPEKAILAVSEILNMPKIRVLEIVTFYSMFNLQPCGKNFVQICGTTPCWLRGSDDIKKACKEHIGQERDISKENISWVEVECLGACVNAPVVQINDEYFEDLDYLSMSKILENLKNNKKVKKGSQINRNSSEPNLREK